MSVIVVLLSALFPASAQNYTTDAILKRTTGKIATLECSGIARTKKEAIEMAKKSVIYTYLYNGIDGLNDNKPLLGSKPSAGAAQYVGQLLGTTRYANYIRSCTIADKTNKTAAKDIQVFATIDLYTESLERDLVNNGIIGRNAADIALSETQEMIAMPTVMVVPFRKSGQSYEEAIRDNSDMRMAISKVNEGFIKQGVETKDLLTSLNNANTYQVRMGDGMSLDDAILINSGADVSVSVDINQDVNDGGVRVSLSTGQSGAVRFTIDPGSAINVDTEINNIMPLSDILVSWVKRHAKNGKYHTQGRTSTLLAFSDIFVDNSMEDGMQSDVNDFALALYQYLKGLNLSVSRTITGNSIDVIIY